jgi:hypothetical protein
MGGAAHCVCSNQRAGSSHRPVRLDGVRSGAISLRQIRDVTTLIYAPKSGGTRRLKISTPDGIFRGSFDRAILIGEIAGKVVLLSDIYGSRPQRRFPRMWRWRGDLSLRRGVGRAVEGDRVESCW